MAKTKTYLKRDWERKGLQGTYNSDPLFVPKEGDAVMFDGCKEDYVLHQLAKGPKTGMELEYWGDGTKHKLIPHNMLEEYVTEGIIEVDISKSHLNIIGEVKSKFDSIDIPEFGDAEFKGYFASRFNDAISKFRKVPMARLGRGDFIKPFYEMGRISSEYLDRIDQNIHRAREKTGKCGSPLLKERSDFLRFDKGLELFREAYVMHQTVPKEFEEMAHKYSFTQEAMDGEILPVFQTGVHTYSTLPSGRALVVETFRELGEVAGKKFKNATGEGGNKPCFENVIYSGRRSSEADNLLDKFGNEMKILQLNKAETVAALK